MGVSRVGEVKGRACPPNIDSIIRPRLRFSPFSGTRSPRNLSVHPLYLKIRPCINVIFVCIRCANRSLSIRLFERFENVPVRRGTRRGFCEGSWWKTQSRRARSGEEKKWKRRGRKTRRGRDACGCTAHNSRRCALCVFSVPNETVVILWSASAAERYTVGMERLGRIAISPSVRCQRFSLRFRAVIFPSPQRAES